MVFDVAIVGLGPAGATLARLLSPDLKVVAIDRKSRTDSKTFSKCCGGLLSDDAQKSLARLGLVLPKRILVDPQIFSVRTIDPKVPEERYYQRFYLNMDRHAFDMWLISLIPERVKIWENVQCTNVVRQENGFFEVTMQQGDTVQSLQARIVVGADGAASMVRQKIGKPHRAKEYVAIQEWFRMPNQRPFYVSLFDEEITDSYCWALSKNDDLIVGAAVPSDDSLGRFERFKSHLENRGFILENKIKREACKVLLTDSFSGQDTGKDGVYFIGEAGGFISSSSLEGISYGMDTAQALANVLNESTEQVTKRYKKATFGLRMKLASKVVKRLPIYQPLLRKLVLASGYQSIRF